MRKKKAQLDPRTFLEPLDLESITAPKVDIKPLILESIKLPNLEDILEKIDLRDPLEKIKLPSLDELLAKIDLKPKILDIKLQEINIKPLPTLNLGDRLPGELCGPIKKGKDPKKGWGHAGTAGRPMTRLADAPRKARKGGKRHSRGR